MDVKTVTNLVSIGWAAFQEHERYTPIKEHHASDQEKKWGDTEKL